MARCLAYEKNCYGYYWLGNVYYWAKVFGHLYWYQGTVQGMELFKSNLKFQTG